jgi:aspartate/methionine/tyrosine aminotransferase
VVAALADDVQEHAHVLTDARGDHPQRERRVGALGDDSHVRVQRERYERRRAALLPALRSAGFTIDHSEAGLYLWATRDEPGRDTVTWLAERGILAAPGDFYGPAGARHVRVALTAGDERVAAAVSRLCAGSDAIRESVS